MLLPSLQAAGEEAHRGWYALHTRYQHERTVAQILSSKAFEVFLPLCTVVHAWKDRNKELSLPLFGCYVFIHGGLERRLQIVTTPGVQGLVGSGGQPCAIPQAEIDAVRQMVESALGIEPHPFLKRGDWVRVKSGPLAGLEGILVRKKNLFRLVISIEMLEKAVAAEVDLCTVERSTRQGARRYPAAPGESLTPGRW